MKTEIGTSVGRSVRLWEHDLDIVCISTGREGRKRLAENPPKFTEWLHHARTTDLCKLPPKPVSQNHYRKFVGCESNMLFLYDILVSPHPLIW